MLVATTMKAPELCFDFESSLRLNGDRDAPAGDEDGRQPIVLHKRHRQTVCKFHLRGLCILGDKCTFLHEYDMERMPLCSATLRGLECMEADCPFVHSNLTQPECRLFALGFCPYGPHCHFKHIRLTGPPPEPESVEAAKPRKQRQGSSGGGRGGGSGIRGRGARSNYGRSGNGFLGGGSSSAAGGSGEARL